MAMPTSRVFRSPSAPRRRAPRAYARELAADSRRSGRGDPLREAAQLRMVDVRFGARDEVRERLVEARALALVEALEELAVEALADLGAASEQPLAGRREHDPEDSVVVGIGPPRDCAALLERSDELRHRLREHAHRARELGGRRGGAVLHEHENEELIRR